MRTKTLLTLVLLNSLVFQVFSEGSHRKGNVNHIDNADSIYAEIPQLIPVNKELEFKELVWLIETINHPLWKFKVIHQSDCKIVFEAYLLDERAKHFDGYYLVEKGHYHSGPHALLKNNNLIIQK